MEKSLIVNTEEILQVHPQITVNVHHMITVCQDGPNLANITSNVEMTDYVLESFMGEPLRMIESDGGSKYEMYQRYRNMIRDLGILSSYGVDDLDELVDNAAVGSIPTALVNELENDFQMMQENKMADTDPIPTILEGNHPGNLKVNA